MKKKVFINMNWEVSAVTRMADYIKMLQGADFDVVIDPRPRKLSEDELIAAIPGSYAFIGSAVPFTPRVMAACPELKIIARSGVGYETIDIPAATRRGIAVTITPGAGAEAVAEYTMALMLAVARRVPEADRAAKSNNWVRFPGASLFHKTLGIVGTGQIGKKLAEISHGFDMKLIAYDQNRDAAFAEKLNVTYCDTLDELLKKADYVSIHVPLLPETRDLIDSKQLGLMKPTAYIVNCARGGIINEQALYQALKEKTLAGAGLDVFDAEPVNPDNPLLTLDNVVASTHNAGTSLEGKNSIVEGAVVNVLEFAAGKRPYGILNPEVLK